MANETKIETKIDYEDVATNVQFDLDKARYLLRDLQSIFDCPDPDYPPRERIESIRYDYKHIVIMLGLLSDVVEKLTTTITPML